LLPWYASTQKGKKTMNARPTKKKRLTIYLDEVDLHRATADATHLEKSLAQYFTALLHHRLNIAELKAGVPYIPPLSKAQRPQSTASRPPLTEAEQAAQIAQDKEFAIKSAVDQFRVEGESIEEVTAYLALWGLTLEDAGLQDAKSN
jgi:hypothetical protein